VTTYFGIRYVYTKRNGACVTLAPINASNKPFGFMLNLAEFDYGLDRWNAKISQ